VEYYAGNRLKEKGYFNNGKKDGLWEEYYKVHQKEKKLFWKNGV